MGSWVRIRVFVLAGLGTGCIESDLVVCGDGTACPVGYTCTSTVGCLSPAQVSACVSHADGESCTLLDDSGTCREAGCIVGRCGDGRVDPNEICDDGNTFGGDGCNGTCSSDERCGNGLTELDEECDCGDATHDGPELRCNATHNGDAICSDTCRVRRCGNDELDPGEVCDDGNITSGDGCSTSCLSDESCGNGIVELVEECDCGDAAHASASVECNGTVNGGTICTVACHERRCGDGAIDPGEVCDDGNTTPGDGCDFTCTSNETCGNGTLDYFAGELCDDTNLRNRDGCAASCQGESLAWHREAGSATPPARISPIMVYDVARHRTVLFGGSADFSSPPLTDTWEFDGTAWRQLSPPTTATGLRNAGVAFDSRRGRVIVFGGVYGASLTPANETWAFDGTTWTNLAPATRPSARSSPAMAYDAARDRVVLFGGNRAGSGLQDTWEFDGTTWTPRTLASPPAGRYRAAMAYDPKRDRIVLYGGTDISGAYLNDTWELGTGWNSITTMSSPGPRHSASAVFDTARGVVTFYGGVNSSGPQGSVWDYNGTNWAPRTLASPPVARSGAGMAFDIRAGRSIIFGGDSGSTTLGDTVDYDASMWTPRNVAPSPLPRNSPAVAHDIANGRVILFGGIATSGATDDTWQYDGSTWTQLSPATKPQARSEAMMAYDKARKVIVLFGGSDGSYRQDTWEFDGVDWRDRTPATGNPPIRAGGAMAYSATRNRVVLFGGSRCCGNYYNDVWEWDGTSWMPRGTVATTRAMSTMTYDAKRGVLVLFGGERSGAALGGVYEYDATGMWTTRTFTSDMPTNRYSVGLTYDPIRERVVLFGGYGLLTSGVFNGFHGDTWEYDGTQWTERVYTTAPSLRARTAAVYDRTRQRVFLIGGAGDDGNLGEVWSYGYDALAAPEACASERDLDRDGAIGCADDECWGVCTPYCLPGATPCPTTATCGDGTCSVPLEDCRSCPGDCDPATKGCTNVCGDSFCDSPETMMSCPGDCS